MTDDYILKLQKAHHELAEMYSGVRYHGENGKRYWIKWLADNDWFFDICQAAIAAELKTLDNQ